MWKNDWESRLYVVKRRNAEEYHCGSYSSATPKLYMLGYAKSACKGLNRGWDRRETYTSLADLKAKKSSFKPRMSDFDSWCEKLYEHYLANEEKGPWVVAVVQFTASEYVES
jgi:hypothetical protein